MSLLGTAKPGQYLTGSINKVTYQLISAYGVAVKNGFKGTEEEWLASLSANPNLIKQNVYEFLSENPVATDATLSHTGMAADAKATGDAIQNAKNEANAHINATGNPHGMTKSDLGLGNVDNTSDMDKPVSNAQRAAIESAVAGVGIDDGAVTSAKIASGAVTSGKIDSGAVTSGKLGNGAVTTAKIADCAVTAEKMGFSVATPDYVDAKRLSGTVTLLTSQWYDKAHAVDVSGILASDMPHWGVVYGTNKEAEKEAFALVDVLETSADKFIFRCFSDVPTVDLVIQWEVNR